MKRTEPKKVLHLEKPKDIKLSYFTGEQHSENYEQVIHLVEGLGYSVRVYESKSSSQFDFLQAVYRDTAIIVDATIPDDLTQSTIYPLLTAHVNILDHILVFSDKQYEDGTQILPLNITPQRVWNDKDKDLLGWLRVQLEDLKAHQYYDRFEIESIDKLTDYKLPMERVMSASLELHKPKFLSFYYETRLDRYDNDSSSGVFDFERTYDNKYPYRFVRFNTDMLSSWFCIFLTPDEQNSIICYDPHRLCDVQYGVCSK